MARLREAQVELLVLPRASRWDLLKWAPLLRRIRAGHVDVLHSHLFGSNFYSALFKRITRLPVAIAHEHVWEFEGQRLRRAIDRYWVARAVDGYLTVSAETKRQMIDIEGIPPTLVEVLPNGVPRHERGSGAQLREDLGIQAGAPIIGGVGFLRRQKRFDVLIDAYRLVVERFPEGRLVIAGDGPEEHSLRAQIRALDLEGRAHLIGRRDDIGAVLDDLSVAVCSSDYEGSPLSVIEYMTAGLPIVSTAVGGVPELIESGESGLLVPPADPHALADAICALLVDPSESERYAASARERSADFSIEATAQQLGRYYMDLLAAHHPTTRS